VTESVRNKTRTLASALDGFVGLFVFFASDPDLRQNRKLVLHDEYLW